MNEPKRFQRRRTRGWKKPPGAVCIGRGKGLRGLYGNPFPVASFRKVGHPDPAAAAVEAFEKWLNGELPYQDAHPEQRARLLTSLPLLRGKHLCCWCAEGKPCHGDVLLRLANG